MFCDVVAPLSESGIPIFHVFWCAATAADATLMEVSLARVNWVLVQVLL